MDWLDFFMRPFSRSVPTVSHSRDGSRRFPRKIRNGIGFNSIRTGRPLCVSCLLMRKQQHVGTTNQPLDLGDWWCPEPKAKIF